MTLFQSGGQYLRLLLPALWALLPCFAQSSADGTFLATLGELREASFTDKATVAEKLIATGHPGVRASLTALFEDRLVYRNADNQVFILKSAEGDPLSLLDPVSLKPAGSAPADSVSKIGTNNSLRKTLRMSLARFSLSSGDPAVRLDAVHEMALSLDETSGARSWPVRRADAVCPWSRRFR